MKKLLQLLNEYDKDSMRTEKSVYAHETGVINKKFWFIERLVKNKKLNLIDFEDVIKRVEFTDNEEFDHYIFYSIIDSLLMRLAIQDNPIEFLISILK